MVDKRFAKVASDPRFKQIKKDKNKVVIDERFDKILDEKSEFGTNIVIDKYGRKLEKSGVEELKRYYRLDKKDEEEEEEDEEKIDEDKYLTSYNNARGEGVLESSDESDDDDEEALLEDVDEDELELVTNDNETVLLGDESARFAVVNLDWDQIKASDLFKVFEGFAPKNGNIKSVMVYPSQFGKERMLLEATQGPPTAIFKSKSTSLLPTKDEDSQEFNNKELRKYQLERLKYYYAVVTCDNAQTAKTIYTACDGAEFEATSNFFDMRFIPDDMEFDDEPTDQAQEAPLVYQAVDFATKALQHSKVELTWDNDDPQRAKVTRRKFTKDDVAQMDFKAYLASDSESDDGDNVEAYKKLLLGNDDVEVEGDMEVTFTQGMAEGVQAALDKKTRDAQIAKETPFETQLRKQKEKRKSRKVVGTVKDDGDDAHTDASSSEEDDDILDESEEPRVEMSKEELELLIDADDKPHFDARLIMKKKEVQTGFDIDTKDSRFKDVFSSHHFAIDPTHPSYKKTDSMQRILKEKMGQIKTEDKEETVVEKRVVQSKDSSKSDLNSLVDAVKRKSESALKTKKGKRKLN